MDHTRHIGIFNASRYSAVLIGAGGIGAMTGITLAKMGIGKLSIYDFDQVDEINLATQFHRLSDIGKEKSAALSDAILDYSGLMSSAKNCRVDQKSEIEPCHLIISAVDNITARKEIWTAVKEAAPLWYLDTRMSAEYFQIFIVDMSKKEWYADALAHQDEHQIPDEPCTSKATIYTACIAAGHIGAATRRIITGTQLPGVISQDIFKNILIQTEM